MTHRAGPITGAAARIMRTPRDGGQDRPTPGRSRHALIALAGALTLTLTLTLALAAPAFAEAPWWSIYAEAGPTHLPPGGEGHINIEVGDLGDREVNASKEPVKLRDALPAGLTAVSVTGLQGRDQREMSQRDAARTARNAPSRAFCTLTNSSRSRSR